ncbi:alanine racemase [Collimonas fungivorans]|nr:alanine racemase [Collimonas fungivorans]
MMPASLWPKDRGAPHDPYFSAINAELRRNGPARPCLVIDLDRLDHNIALVRQVMGPGRSLRVVAKSLPSLALLDYVLQASGSSRLMAFHQPFLSDEARRFPQLDFLLGKPMPVRAAAAFYDELQGPFDAARQLQWLLDTPQRLAQYLTLAQQRGLSMRINIELDVGLHRGGVAEEKVLASMLEMIERNPAHLTFGGFMGYEPHVAKLPRAFGTQAQLHGKVLQRYRAFMQVVSSSYPKLLHPGLTLNAGGSMSYRLYGEQSPINDISVGSAFLKPADFDLGLLAEHQPAMFIAAPVLKVLDGTRIPGADWIGKAAAWWNPNRRLTYFLYGGHWLARYESPRGLLEHPMMGYSTNQQFVNGSAATALAPDDYVFLWPTQSEAVMLQFGAMVILRQGKIIDYWPVLGSSDPGPSHEPASQVQITDREIASHV